MSEYQFPYPFPGGPPRFDNKHLTMLLLEEYQQREVIKPCVHVRLAQVRSRPLEVPDWGLICRQDSFAVVPGPTGSAYDLAPDDIFLGCPGDCRFFVPVAQARRKRRAAAIGHGILTTVRAPFAVARWLLVWFAGLPATTQALMILGALLVFGILTWPQFVEIFDKVRGTK